MPIVVFDFNYALKLIIKKGAPVAFLLTTIIQPLPEQRHSLHM